MCYSDVTIKPVDCRTKCIQMLGCDIDK